MSHPDSEESSQSDLDIIPLITLVTTAFGSILSAVGRVPSSCSCSCGMNLLSSAKRGSEEASGFGSLTPQLAASTCDSLIPGLGDTQLLQYWKARELGASQTAILVGGRAEGLVDST
eukprot:CAMPEP_0184313780 /NCGR_PEP_ID=MMETSP1049-20130417/67334_1 /TAXON_ID=77928 /ORGANISM="Proteomonas sulcata, Strain CCMP704" /LENGTH=116 /DNA_ID=CAMNT_0026631267 /DNA_START=434 /DNA_END=785 /DNA_ORIENTATION=+